MGGDGERRRHRTTSTSRRGARHLDGVLTKGGIAWDGEATSDDAVGIRSGGAEQYRIRPHRHGDLTLPAARGDLEGPAAADRCR